MSAESPLTELENSLGPRLFSAQFGGPPIFFAGRFELLEIRGRGARGLVVKARDTNLDRLVALKLFPSPEASLVAETKAEAKTLARLSHPNIVTVIDLSPAILGLGDRAISCLYLAMEYIEGPHIRAWITSANPSPEQIIAAFLAAGEGLVAAHEAGVIHRDVKPANIVIDHQTARVVDFGLARVIPPGSDPAEPRHTQYGATKGTLEYMSPEARRGRADARSDIFSFAASLWECLAGVLPFDPSAGEWRLGHQTDFEGAKELPPALAQVLRRALSYLPEQRHSSMRDLLDELRTATRPRRAVRRPVMIASGALLVIASALAFPIPRNNASPDAPTTPPATDAGNAAPAPTDANPTHAASIPANAAPAPTDANPTHTASVPANAAPPPTCDNTPLGGPWRLTTRVLWADDSYWIGVEGFYRLEIEVDARCELAATLTRIGDSGNPRYRTPRTATTTLTALRDSDGDLWWTGTFDVVEPRRPHIFTFTYRDGELVGDWSFHENAAYPSMTGILRAARGTSVGPVPSDLSATPCPSTCRILCAGPAARARCQETCAARGGADHCAPVDNDAPVPTGAITLLSILRDGASELEAPGTKCREHARLLAGTWSIHTPGSRNELEITPSGCEILGEVTPPDGALPYYVTGRVNKLGQWYLRPPRELGGPAWVLTGRDPALGITSDREPVTATRGRSRDSKLPRPP